MSRLFGDWDRVEDIFDMFRHDYVKNLRDVLERAVAKDIEIKLKDNVIKQLLNLAPLSPEYRERKRSEGLDIRTLIATGEYINSLQVEKVEETADSVIFFIGATEGMHHSGLTFAELSEIIEYGTSTQPPRPHIRMTWEMIKGEVESKVVQILESELFKRI